MLSLKFKEIKGVKDKKKKLTLFKIFYILRNIFLTIDFSKTVSCFEYVPSSYTDTVFILILTGLEQLSLFLVKQLQCSKKFFVLVVFEILWEFFRTDPLLPYCVRLDKSQKLYSVQNIILNIVWTILLFQDNSPFEIIETQHLIVWSLWSWLLENVLHMIDGFFSIVFF